MHCLIVEDHPVTLFGLRVLVQKNFPVWTISTANCIKDAMKSIESPTDSPIKLVLVDIGLPDGSGMDLLDFFHTNFRNECACLVISGDSDEGVMSLCKTRGAKGYLPKDHALDQLLQAIEAVQSGAEYFPYSVGEKKVLSNEGDIRFSSRQKDLARLVIAGYSNKKIAETLGITYGTVKNYMFDLMRLLSVNSRLEMAAKLRECNALWVELQR